MKRRRAPGYSPCVPGADRLAWVAVTDPLGRVLVVDDDEVIRQLIAVNLQLEGFEVETAVDGQDCLDKVIAVDPAVITLDIMMPRLDGWVTAVKLREDPATSHMKVVMITARAQDHDIRRGHEIGVDAYVTKPFDPAELIRTVRKLAGAGPHN
ncbi:response regulator [Actinomadura alba]|uniref:Response regulator n=1 Tax=Actinomadura alba TaxID=406431 RepID=A0ABR7LLZ0_9ACTN|nr:response regulator [Actinomadura alba]